MRTIQVNGIRVFGYHGCLEEEAKVGTWFGVDVEVTFNFSTSAQTDDLSKTIDYVRIREIVEEQVKRRANLIETVIERIAGELKQVFPEITGYKIALRKYSPPINGEVDHVAVTLEERW